MAAAQQGCGDWTMVESAEGVQLKVTEVEVRSPDEAYAWGWYRGLIRWDGVAWSQFVIEDPVGDYSAMWMSVFGLVGPNHLFLTANGETSPFTTDQTLKIWDGKERATGTR